MASILQRIERIEQARRQAAEKHQEKRQLDPLTRALRLQSLYASAGRTDLEPTRRMRALRVVALLDIAADRAGRPRLSEAPPAPLRVVNTSTTSTTTPPTGPTPSDVRAQLERQAQRRDAEAFHRLTH